MTSTCCLWYCSSLLLCNCHWSLATKPISLAVQASAFLTNLMPSKLLLLHLQDKLKILKSLKCKVSIKSTSMHDKPHKPTCLSTTFNSEGMCFEWCLQSYNYCVYTAWSLQHLRLLNEKLRWWCLFWFHEQISINSGHFRASCPTVTSNHHQVMVNISSVLLLIVLTTSQWSEPGWR